MKRKATFLILIVSFARALAAGPDDSSPASGTPSLPPGERYLFVVGTSTSMERLEHDGRQALFNLVYTGIDGHMRPGDTFGVWTFNHSLNTGQLPMQTWNTNDLLQLASKVSLYVKEQPYDGKLKSGELLEALGRVLSNVGNLHVLIITDETFRFQGTPFDDVLNSMYERRADAVDKSLSPLITTLEGRNGRFVGADVALAGEDLQLPSRAAPEPPPEPAVPKALSSQPAGTGTKAAPKPAAAPRTIVIKRDTRPDGSKSGVQVQVDGKAAPVATKEDDAPLEIVTMPARVPGSNTTTTTVSPAEPEPAAPPVATATPAVTAPDPSVGDAPTAPASPETSTSEASRAATGRGNGGLAAAVARLDPNPMPVTARGSGSDVPAPATSAMTGVATPRAQGSGDRYLWILGGITFVVAAVVLAICFAWIQRRSQQASVITQSMYRR